MSKTFQFKFVDVHEHAADDVFLLLRFCRIVKVGQTYAYHHNSYLVKYYKVNVCILFSISKIYLYDQIKRI